MHPNKISAAIITFNEEKNIGRCLASLKNVVDEIVVLDSFSTDQTEEICREYGVTFMQNPFKDYSDQKRKSVEATTHQYVLSLDADEALDETLKNSILKEKNDLSEDAYTFERKTKYCGKWIHHSGWREKSILRLWNKEKGNWSSSPLHESIQMMPDSSFKKIPGAILHYTISTVADHIQKIQKYSTLSAQKAHNEGKKTTFLKVLLAPIFKFFRDYILKLGFLDGHHGLIICINSAFDKYLKYLKLYELNQKRKKI